MKGILLIDKPPDWTSQDVCAKLRGALHERRIGHAGTLDPMATGLLAVFVGRATRAVEFAQAHDKQYLCSLRLGLVTDTQDTTGRELERRTPEVTEAALQAVLPEFTGELLQTPPMYSAIKRGGQKLCDVARRGGSVELAPRPITVRRIELLGRDGTDWRLRIDCGKGTYVRTLCHDIGARLGCGGCMSALRRTAAGPYRIEQAQPLEAVLAAADAGRAEALLLPVESVFAALPAVTLDAQAEARCRVGAPYAAAAAPGRCRVYARSGEFLALAEADGTQAVSIKSFFEVEHGS